VSDYLELRNAKEQSQGVEVTAPDGKRPLGLGEAASAQRLQLNQAGYYQIRLANGRQDLIGVNPDPKESNLDVIPGDVLTLWRGEGDQTSPEALGVHLGFGPTKTRQTLWWYLMLLAFACAAAESVLARRYLGVQREES